jgi:hypothetical protein
MPKRKKFTDSDVVDVYAAYAVDHFLPPSPFVRLSARANNTAARRAIDSAIRGGFIEHSGNIDKGWLTAKGIDWLHPEMKKRYLEALRGRNTMRAG